ncbi:hypothetical protein [Desulfoluna spongiiphila]|uniref:hypothetical protein n=1 Tax=Desulfoluna spongiiphila TaxID=419481 RepID=UPI00125F9227|nr:hypothetical protein [Desulfoluna spongiiphila]
MEMIDKLVESAERAVRNTLSSPSKIDSILEFQDFDFSGMKSILMLVGYVCHEVEDGVCIAVLNPDADLRGKLKPNVGYMPPTLKKIASQKCDAFVQVRVEPYKSKRNQLYVLIAVKGGKSIPLTR